MKIVKLPYDLSVCKVKQLNNDILNKQFVFIGKTKKEISIVCETSEVPSDFTDREDGWKCFYIDGVLDFSLVGILAKISQILADNGISTFAVSTYDTDYILVKAEKFENVIKILQKEELDNGDEMHSYEEGLELLQGEIKDEDKDI